MFDVIRSQSSRLWFGARYFLSQVAMVLFLVLAVVLLLKPFPMNIILMIPYVFFADLAYERIKSSRAVYLDKAAKAREIMDEVKADRVGSRAYAGYKAWQQMQKDRRAATEAEAAEAA